MSEDTANRVLSAANKCSQNIIQSFLINCTGHSGINFISRTSIRWIHCPTLTATLFQRFLLISINIKVEKIIDINCYIYILISIIIEVIIKIPKYRFDRTKNDSSRVRVVARMSGKEERRKKQRKQFSRKDVSRLKDDDFAAKISTLVHVDFNNIRSCIEAFRGHWVVPVRVDESHRTELITLHN